MPGSPQGLVGLKDDYLAKYLWWGYFVGVRRQ